MGNQTSRISGVSTECPVHDEAAQHDGNDSDQQSYTDPGYSSDDTQLEDDYMQLEDGKNRMIAAGWCPHQVKHLSRSYDLKTFRYLTTLQYTRPEKHDRCTSHSSCVAYHADLTSYETQHTHDLCNCSLIAIPSEQLAKVIRSGGIPLIRFMDGYEPVVYSYDIEVVPRKRAHHYFAVSHVWADGLGNPSKNGLYACQMKRLRSTFKKLSESSLVSPRYTPVSSAFLKPGKLSYR